MLGEKHDTERDEEIAEQEFNETDNEPTNTSGEAWALVRPTDKLHDVDI
ncbi:35470_t:CDS:2 [Gigaspora margarita]|uniref:35470_t:CDS:1 n=1 Tax=Gigaspora margarita TaxID=4874 RepID=A0ABN7UM74_GIGMA|nr:35470_t:CDS:2 [Gigaspora margarita]